MATTIKIGGIIGWTVSADSFRETFPSDKDVELIIDSDGGSCVDGIAIAEFIKYKRASEGYKVTAKILGMCGSISTIIALACERVSMSPLSTFFVHKSQISVFGNAEDLEKAKEEVEAFDLKMLAVYMEKTGKSEAEIRKIMDEEKLITAEKAKELGFVDEVMDFGKNAANAFKERKYSAVAKYERAGESEAHVYITINQAEESPGAVQSGESESEGQPNGNEEPKEGADEQKEKVEETKKSAEEMLAEALAVGEEWRKKYEEITKEVENMKNMMSEAQAKAEVRAAEAKAKLTEMPVPSVPKAVAQAPSRIPYNVSTVPQAF